jgi:hypothetical protein
VAAGAKHSGSAQVAEQVCRVLRSLASRNEAKKAAIRAAGGIEELVRVLGEHHANAAVMEHACVTLAMLDCVDDYKARIAAAGDIEALVRVLGEHHANAAVTETACWAGTGLRGAGELISRSRLIRTSASLLPKSPRGVCGLLRTRADC